MSIEFSYVNDTVNDNCYSAELQKDNKSDIHAIEYTVGQGFQ